MARHARAGWRTPLIALGVVALAAAGIAGPRLVPDAPLAAADEQPADQRSRWRQPTVGPSESPAPEPDPTLSPLGVAPVTVSLDAVDGWWSWAMLDQRTGEIHGSANLAETSTTASLIKAWIAADYLRTSAEAGRSPNDFRMRQLEIMIRDSDNQVAEELWQEIGRTAATERMIRICGLTDSRSSTENRWSTTRLSPRDVARLGACITDGRAAGAEWTDWLLAEMRSVRSPGDFGVIEAFPAAEAARIAIKNGWVIRDADREWHVNCLAIGDGWTIGVMTRFPADRPFAYGGQICREVAEQLRAAATASTGG
ncbi:serine hydrolase [Solwaraspora sp. WMMD937]|uniref:serine hydrolase n=1 Tax=Solwaraspora sp. WMMD937 TaxID=3016090 RepID=UPI00249AE6AB|nr:serine hydrolase [Solwaraspora sp. WMMD937]WFE23054.1 serine hydrolase [Solwaraspora sp. WMMD937]